MYKNSDFESDSESDFESDCEAVSNRSSDFEGFLVSKARLQNAESERRAFRKSILKDASSERMQL